MTKNEFLKALRLGLNGIPESETEERINFYGEIIDDRIDEGASEQEAVESLGSVDEIVSQIMSEIPLISLVREKVKPKRALKVFEIILLVLGSPIWFSVLLSLFSVFLSVYIVFWSIIITLWAALVSLFATAIAGIFMMIFCIIKGNIISSLAMLGITLAGFGLLIFGFFGCKWATKGFVILNKKIFISIKRMFIKKEAVK